MQSTSATNAASDALSQKDRSAGCPTSRRCCEKWVLHRLRSRPRLSSGNLYPTSAKIGQKWGTRPLLFSLEITLRVPHSCVFRKSGNLDLDSLYLRRVAHFSTKHTTRNELEGAPLLA